MDVVTYSHDAGLATIALADPDRGNPINRTSTEQLLRAVRRASSDDARVVLLRAEGWAFSVGGDLRSFGTAPDPGEALDEVVHLLHRFVADLQALDAVVVSAVQGVAAGAGFPLAAAADLVLAAESARFLLGYTKIGYTPDGGATLLTASLGLHRVLTLALLNDAVTAAEAHRLGLVARVVPDGELDRVTQEVAAKLLSGSRTAQVQTKRLARATLGADVDAALRREAVSLRRAAESEDGRIGVAAFLRKQPPGFPSASAHQRDDVGGVVA